MLNARPALPVSGRFAWCIGEHWLWRARKTGVAKWLREPERCPASRFSFRACVCSARGGAIGPTRGGVGILVRHDCCTTITVEGDVSWKACRHVLAWDGRTRIGVVVVAKNRTRSINCVSCTESHAGEKCQRDGVACRRRQFRQNTAHGNA